MGEGCRSWSQRAEVRIKSHVIAAPQWCSKSKLVRVLQQSVLLAPIKIGLRKLLGIKSFVAVWLMPKKAVCAIECLLRSDGARFAALRVLG